MPNVQAIISSPWKRSSYQMPLQWHLYNNLYNNQRRLTAWKKRPECPLEGNYLPQNVIYQETVTNGTTTYSYIGLLTSKNGIGTTWHPSDTRTEVTRRNCAKNVRTLKDANRSFHMQWKVLRNCKPYDNVSMLAKNVICVFKKNV